MKVFLNPAIVKLYESEIKDETVRVNLGLYIYSFIQSEKESKSKAITAFKKLGHKCSALIDTCDSRQREWLSRCERCNEPLYLRGNDAFWKGFVGQIKVFEFHHNIFNTTLRTVYWVVYNEWGVAEEHRLNSDKFDPDCSIICKRVQCML